MLRSLGRTKATRSGRARLRQEFAVLSAKLRELAEKERSVSKERGVHDGLMEGDKARQAKLAAATQTLQSLQDALVMWGSRI